MSKKIIGSLTARKLKCFFLLQIQSNKTLSILNEIAAAGGM